jgi:hypothetical protein
LVSRAIVSKRLGSPYVSGRSRHWIKNKNPQHPAVKREAEEDWAESKESRAGKSPGDAQNLEQGAAGRSRPPLQRSHLLTMLRQQSFNQ